MASPVLAPALAPSAPDEAFVADSPGAADPQDAQRFAALMEARVNDDGTAAVQSAAPAEGRTLGDNILGGLQRLSTDLQHTWTNVGDALSRMGPQPSVHDMLAVQMHLSTMSVQYELVSKAVSRSTQNIDQLVKLQ
jgi:type III secretion protein I